MSRKKQPVAALRASGSRHYASNVLDAREACEPKVPPSKKLEPPHYLAGALREKYTVLAAELMQLGLLTDLDSDALARYLIAEANYLRVTSRLTAALNTGALADAVRLSSMQDRFFKQCRAGAADLGLSPGLRCGLAVPALCGTEDDEEVALFGS